MLVQTLWKLKMDWDEPLKQELADKWSTIATDIQDAITISHPRLCCNPDTQATATQLHVFADASPHAYGAVAYLRQDGQVRIMIARSRVAPVKPTTLPRLELMAAVIATRLAKFVIHALPSTFTDITTHLWTDSQITLHWIYDLKQSISSKPFIGNRVAEITESFPANTWRTYFSQSRRFINKRYIHSPTKNFRLMASWTPLVDHNRAVAHMVTNQCTSLSEYRYRIRYTYQEQS